MQIFPNLSGIYNPDMTYEQFRLKDGIQTENSLIFLTK